mmetsp:Transcript_50830/g.145929  ORF Transcript_50830/g.145929 Transcript_50830/m.145929 type:complete len:408 (-) Transcript_50830:33-1256(-)
MASEEVEEFIRQNQLDNDSSRSLRNCPIEILRSVLDRGDLRGARNPSSAVMMRIRDAKASAGAPMSRPAAAAPLGVTDAEDPQLRMEIESFLVQNAIDDSASNALRACNTLVQRCVLGRGDLGGARNPSSALLTRIKDAKLMGLDPNAAAELPTGDNYMLGGCGASAAAGSGAYGGGLTYVKMRGLPFQASKEDVMHFFAHYQVASENVTLGINNEGRASGEAFVRFPQEMLAREAVRDRNRQRMEHRYIELFVMTASEVQRAKLPDAELVTTSSVPPPALQHLQPGYSAAQAAANAAFGYVPMAAVAAPMGGCGGYAGCGGAATAAAGYGGAEAGGVGSDYVHQLAAYYGSYQAAAQALGACGMASATGYPGLPGLTGAPDASGAAAAGYGAAPDAQGYQARASPY